MESVEDLLFGGGVGDDGDDEGLEKLWLGFDELLVGDDQLEIVYAWD